MRSFVTIGGGQAWVGGHIFCIFGFKIGRCFPTFVHMSPPIIFFAKNHLIQDYDAERGGSAKAPLRFK